MKTLLPLILLAALPLALPAQEAAHDDAGELAKQLSNPVASLISVPFQANWDFGIGEEDATRFTLNIQPVVPFELNSEMNLIVRTILPVIYAEAPVKGLDDESGLGDTTQTFFFSPREPVGGWILGAGPAFLWPTSTNDALGSGKWGAGPSLLALQQNHGWTYGVLANHLWSYADASSDEHSDVNATFVQPFLSYQFKTATTVGVNTESTYDWTADQWTVPINGFVSQVVNIGGHPTSFTLGGRYYAEAPEGGPEWGVRAVVTLLFPEKKGPGPMAIGDKPGYAK